MKNTVLVLIGLMLPAMLFPAPSPKNIFENNRKNICLVSYYQNTSSDSRIGSFNKIRRHRIGILVSADGLVMVSSDVYPVSLDIISGSGSFLSGKPTDFKVKLYDGKEYPAEFLGKDDQAKVGFIRILNPDKIENLRYVTFSSAKQTGITDTVFILELMPATYNFEPLFTEHHIAAEIQSPRRKFIINNYTPALSAGGLVLNRSGEAIGITLKQEINFNFRPPVDFEEFHKDYLEIAPAGWFMDLIKNPPRPKKNTIVQKSWLGIRMQGLSADLKKFWKVPADGGVVVDQVYPQSPAEKAGIKTGDVLLAVNDSVLNVTSDEQTEKLRSMVRSIPPGTTVGVKLFRGKKELQKEIHLTAAPKALGVAESFPVPELGFEIRELTRDVLYEEDLPLSTPGVFVYQVDRASPAGIAGLSAGSIIQEYNGQPVKNLDEAERMIRKSLRENVKKIMLRIFENRSTRFVFIDLSK